MSESVRFVCLANSTKNRGRCIAGRIIGEDREFGSWIRPVSARPTREVDLGEMRLLDGSTPSLLDIIEVNVTNLPVHSLGHQVENRLIDRSAPWRRLGRISVEELGRATEPSGELWGHGFSSSKGQHDRIPATDLAYFRHSLRLVHVPLVTIQVTDAYSLSGEDRKQVRALFRLGNVGYCLKVKDPDIELPYLQREKGEYRLGPSFVTVSVAEPYDDGYGYKLVAAIIEDVSRNA